MIQKLFDAYRAVTTVERKAVINHNHEDEAYKK